MIFTEKYMNHRSKEAETMNKKKKLDQNTIQTAKRLLKYMTGTHKIQFIIVFVDGPRKIFSLQISPYGI